MKNEKLEHLWVAVNKDGGFETIIRTCRTRSLARTIATEFKNNGKNVVARKFVATS